MPGAGIGANPPKPLCEPELLLMDNAPGILTFGDLSRPEHRKEACAKIFGVLWAPVSTESQKAMIARGTGFHGEAYHQAARRAASSIPAEHRSEAERRRDYLLSACIDHGGQSAAHAKASDHVINRRGPAFKAALHHMHRMLRTAIQVDDARRILGIPLEVSVGKLLEYSIKVDIIEGHADDAREVSWMHDTWAKHKCVSHILLALGMFYEEHNDCGLEPNEVMSFMIEALEQEDLERFLSYCYFYQERLVNIPSGASSAILLPDDFIRLEPSIAPIFKPPHLGHLPTSDLKLYAQVGMQVEVERIHNLLNGLPDTWWMNYPPYSGPIVRT